MRPMFQPLVGLVLTIGLATGAHATSNLTVFSAAEPIALVDASGAHWRGSDDGLVKKAPSGAFGEVIVARFIGEGIQIENHAGKVFMPIEGRSTGFYGERSDPNTVFKLIRHYDGKVSLISQDGKTLFVDSDQTIRREKMVDIKKNARFSLFSATEAGKRSAVDAFDCSPARIKDIRKRYSKVANNKTLTTKVVASEFEHEYHSKTTHRFFKGAVAEEHIRSGFSGMEANRYTYFHQSQRAYFEYDVSYSDGAGETTEVRRYSSGKGTLCRCLYRSFMDGESAGPQYQSACEYESVKRNPQRAWE